MVVFSCDICNYTTKYKCNFKKHETTKKHRAKCESIKSSQEEYGGMNPNEHKMNPNEHKMNPNEHKVSIIKCEFCDYIFSSKASMRRHLKKHCRKNPDVINKIIDAKDSKIKALEKNNMKLEEEKAHLYQQVSTLLEKVGNTTNIQNNIILNNYGNEDLSHITDKLKTELLQIPYFAIPKIIEAIHFNDKKPENKNIMMPNKKDNLVKVFQGDKWIYKNKNETINDLVDSKYSIIDGHYDIVGESKNISPHVKTSFTKFKGFYEAGDVEMVDALKRECELVLLNNR